MNAHAQKLVEPCAMEKEREWAQKGSRTEYR